MVMCSCITGLKMCLTLQTVEDQHEYVNIRRVSFSFLPKGGQNDIVRTIGEGEGGVESTYLCAKHVAN